MKPQLQQWVYTAKSKHYTWSSVVVATNMKEARKVGLREARKVMGACAVIRYDVVKPLTP